MNTEPEGVYASKEEVDRRRSVDSQLAAFSTRIGSLESAMRDRNIISAGIKDEVSVLKTEMKANTEITREVRNILVTFKNIGRIAKWCSYILGAIAAGFAVVKGIRG